MTQFQKTIKYLAIAFALFLAASIILGTISFFGGIFMFSNNILDEHYEVSVSQNIETIEIDVSAADLKIVEGDKFTLSTNIKDLKVTNNNGKLDIYQKQRGVFFSFNKSGEILLTIPAGASIKSFDLEAGAGKVNIIGSLECQYASFEFGAGQVDIEKLVVTNECKIETGAGQITINDGAINDLDFDMGVGESNIRALLLGNCKLNGGVGEFNLELLSPADDYRLDIDTGIGSLTVDGSRVDSNRVWGNGKNNVKIDGGVGAINIVFEK